MEQIVVYECNAANRLTVDYQSTADEYNLSILTKFSEREKEFQFNLIKKL